MTVAATEAQTDDVQENRLVGDELLAYIDQASDETSLEEVAEGAGYSRVHHFLSMAMRALDEMAAQNL